MHVNLGEKIKELRKRDCRKQEDLAKALGVTSQAVSRWEANGGYPDMSMIPAIANFFHITIDELFGYNNDRNQKIREYCDKAQKMLNCEQDMTECISFLRKGLEEFPEEISIKIRLANALNKQGWNHKGEVPNESWEEAAMLYEDIMEVDSSCIVPLLSIYSELGEKEKAVKKASDQLGIELCKEVLLGNLLNVDDEGKYHGEAILALLHHLRFAIDTAIARDDELKNSKEAIDILLAELDLFGKILGDDCLGYHSEFCFIYMQLVEIAGNLGDYEAAIKYFDSAFDEYTKFNEVWGKSFTEYTKMTDDGYFATPILRSVKKCTGKVHFLEAKFLEYSISSFPDEVKNRITSNEKYAMLF